MHNCNISSEAILKDVFYEVNGFKFSKYYYEKLWSTGRKAPSLRAKATLELGINKGQHKMNGFYRYEYDGWEMRYNPSTKEVWHLQPMKK